MRIDFTLPNDARARVPLQGLDWGHPVFTEPAAGTSLQAWAAHVERFGAVGAVQRVRGDYAIALQLADGSVLLAVDRFARHPLCYRVDGSTVRCGDKADELADDGGGLEAQALFDYLYFHSIPSPRTAFAGVHRLPAGHYLHIGPAGLKSGRYWTPSFVPAVRPGFDDLRSEFRGLLRQAVRRQMADHGPAACFLSGGTDSSTVAGMLSELADHQVKCYSIGFEAEGYDEMMYARIAVQRFGCAGRERYVTPEDLLRDIPLVAGAYDQPFGNSSALPAYHCAQFAHDDGVRHILAGDGGDELFGGNTRYATQELFALWGRLPSALRRHVLEPVLLHGSMARIPVLRRGAGYIRQANTPLPDRAQTFNLLRRLGYAEVLSPGLLALVDEADVLAQQRRVWDEAQAEHELNRHLAFDWRYTLADCDLPKVTGTAALAGLSVAFPMLDDDLVDFSMRLPVDHKLRRRSLRWFFKQALREFLPREIIEKPKQGFGLPFGVWMVQHSGLQSLARDALGALTSRGLVREAFCRELLDRHLPTHPHYYGTMVWVLIMLEHWLRAHRPSFALCDLELTLSRASPGR